MRLQYIVSLSFFQEAKTISWGYLEKSHGKITIIPVPYFWAKISHWGYSLEFSVLVDQQYFDFIYCTNFPSVFCSFTFSEVNSLITASRMLDTSHLSYQGLIISMILLSKTLCWRCSSVVENLPISCRALIWSPIPEKETKLFD
jgi:hypothetical protein